MNNIIAFGPSYGYVDTLLDYKSTSSHLNIPKLGDDSFNVINYRLPSHGIETFYHFVLNSIDHWIEKYGKDDLFILVEVSGLDRRIVAIPTFLSPILEEAFPVHSVDNVPELGFNEVYDTIFGVNGQYFFNPDFTFTDYELILKRRMGSGFKYNRDLANIFKEYHLTLLGELRKPEDTLIKNLSYVLSTQQLLESKGVSYGMTTMKDVFGGYYFDEGELKHLHDRNVLNNQMMVDPIEHGFYVSTSELYVENVMPSISYITDNIDWSKFFFYGIHPEQRGGIDEYVMHKFGIHGYGEGSEALRTMTLDEYYEFRNKRLNATANYENHPELFAHYLFNIRALNKFLELGMSEERLTEIEEFVFDTERCVNIESRHPFPDNGKYLQIL